ncbi:MAG: ABC transporter substrate-binding protein [Clostridia bacterium]|nr:ABC transporter substrate-binding protein [Clostridia bacterium]
MSKIKKVVSLVTSLAMAGAVTAGLTGCGDSKGEDTLLWYVFGDKPADLDTVLAKANEIIEPEIGMKLDMQYIDSASYTSKMKNIMAAHEKYDLAFTGFVNPYQEAVALGGLYDITDLVKETGLDKEMPDFYLDSASVDGRIYGIPNVQVVSNPVSICMDKSLAEEIGVDMKAIEDAAQNAKNFEDVKAYSVLLDDLFAKVHAARPDLYVMNPTYDLLIDPFYEQVVSETYIRKDGSSDEIVIDMETEEGKFSAEKLNEWFNKGYIRNDISSTGTAVASNEEWRKIAVRSTTWKPGQDAYDVERYGEEQVYAKLCKPYVGRTSALATMTSVGADSKHPKEAVELLKLMNTNKELFNIICWGIEGTHYTVADNGHIAEVENSGYNGIGQNAWRFGNQFNALLLENQEDDTWEKTEQMNNDAIKSKMLGFVPNTDVITNELANITNVADEYKAKREFGTIEVSKWDKEYADKLDKAGIHKVRDELQKQYDEFLNK